MKLEGLTEFLGSLVILALAGASASGKLWIINLSVEGVAGGIDSSLALLAFLGMTTIILGASAIFIPIDRLTESITEN